MAKRDFMDVLKDCRATSSQNFWPQIGAELTRLRTQGAMEMAHALFGGTAFTPYGPGQTLKPPELGNDGQQTNDQAATPQPEPGPEQTPEQQQEHGGREM